MLTWWGGEKYTLGTDWGVCSLAPPAGGWIGCALSIQWALNPSIDCFVLSQNSEINVRFFARNPAPVHHYHLLKVASALLSGEAKSYKVAIISSGSQTDILPRVRKWQWPKALGGRWLEQSCPLHPFIKLLIFLSKTSHLFGDKSPKEAELSLKSCSKI